MDVQQVLQSLQVAFQPIVNLHTGDIFGHEALIRGPAGSDWEMPSQLFPAMEAAGAGSLLEDACRREAASRGARLLPDGHTLFMNVGTRYALFAFPIPPRFRDTPHQLAIEISEQYPLLDNDALLTAIRQWRERGHLIVLDDYGTGYAAATTVLAFQPDIVKLDIGLVRDIDRDARRQAIVASIRDYTHDLGIRLVAEGIETESECAVLRQIGVDYGQGFWLRRPDITVSTHLTHQPPSPGDSRPIPRRPPAASPILDFYAAAIHQADIPMYLVNRRRQIVAWNAAAVQAVGYAEPEMVGRACFRGSLRHQDLSGRALCVGACPLVHSMVSKNVVGPSPITLMTAEGTRIPATTVVVPLWDPVRQRIIGAVEQFWSASTVSPPIPVLSE